MPSSYGFPVAPGIADRILFDIISGNLLVYQPVHVIISEDISLAGVSPRSSSGPGQLKVIPQETSWPQPRGWNDSR